MSDDKMAPIDDARLPSFRGVIPENAQFQRENSFGCVLTFGEQYVIAYAPYLMVLATATLETIFPLYILRSPHSMTVAGVSTTIYGVASALSDVFIQRFSSIVPIFHSIQPFLSACGWLTIALYDAEVYMIYLAAFLIGFGQATTANQHCLLSLESDISVERRTFLRSRFFSTGNMTTYLSYVCFDYFGKEVLFSIVACFAILWGVLTIIFYMTQNRISERVLITAESIRFGAQETIRQSMSRDFVLSKTTNLMAHPMAEYLSHDMTLTPNMTFTSNMALTPNFALTPNLAVTPSVGGKQSLDAALSSQESMLNSIRGVAMQQSLFESIRGSGLSTIQNQKDIEHRFDTKLLIALLICNFTFHAVLYYYFMFTVFWVDKLEAPTWTITIFPMLCSFSQAFVIDAYQYVSWGIFHKFPLALLTAIIMLLTGYSVYNPFITFPFFIYPLCHFISTIGYYSYVLQEMMARLRVSTDTLTVSAYMNFSSMLGGGIVGSFLGPFMYSQDLYTEGMWVGIVCALVAGIAVYAIGGSKEILNLNIEKSVMINGGTSRFGDESTMEPSMQIVNMIQAASVQPFIMPMSSVSSTFMNHMLKKTVFDNTHEK